MSETVFLAKPMNSDSSGVPRRSVLWVIPKTAGKIAFFVAVWALCSGPAFAVAIALGKRYGFDGLPRFIADVGSAAGMVLATWATLRIFEKERLAESTLGQPLSVGILGAGGLLGMTIMSLVCGVEVLSRVARPNALVLANAGLLALTSLGLVANTFLQEALFRGYIFQAVRRASSPAWAVLVTTLLFVGAHGVVYGGGPDALWGGLNLATAGVLLGLSVAWTGSIWLGFATHLVWNWLQSPLFGQAGAGYLSGFDGSLLKLSAGHGVETTRAGLIGPVAGVALLVAWRTARPKPLNTRNNIPPRS